MRSNERVKNGFNKGKQRYIYKNREFNYTRTKYVYPHFVRSKALRYYFEEIGFRRNE